MPRPSEVFRPDSGDASEGALLAAIDALDLISTRLDGVAQNTNVNTAADNIVSATNDVATAIWDTVEYTFDYMKTANGRSHTGGSGVLTSGIASNLRATLENPVGSGKKLHVFSFTMVSSVATTLALRVNPTTGLPTTVRSPANKIIGGPASVANLKSDLNATGLGGGSLASTELRLPADQRVVVDLGHPFILNPGVVLGVGIPLPTGGTVNFNVSFWEGDI